MATLVLGTVGRALGGPVGGIVGTLLGSALDRSLLGGGRRREGPRLANLEVQSSAYGAPLPRLYGRLRVAGNVIWSSGIRESKSNSGGGKRGPRTTNYSYSASFAVALSARPIAGVARVWADGALLRDATGAWATPVTMRIHDGGERQAIDPLIAAAEPDAAPAYRGLAYAVFEDLPLAEFGNRIPNLTFEVEADAGEGIGLDAAAADLVGATAAIGPGFPDVTGFAAVNAGSIRTQLEALSPFVDLVVRDDGAGLILAGAPPSPPIAVPADALGAGTSGSAGPAREESRTAAASLADALSYGFYDPTRDYQPGAQRAVRRAPAQREERLDLPAALAPETAKAFAARALARGAARSRAAEARLPWRHAGLRPGDRVTLGADGRSWRVRRVQIAGAVVTLALEAEPRPAAGGPADGGRSLATPARPAGPTTFHLFELPPLPGALPVTPRLWAAAAGAAPGWRGAAITLSGDGGESYLPAGQIEAASVMGVSTAALPAGSPLHWDRTNRLDVELLAADMLLENRSEAAVLAGANLALIGDELVQFSEVSMLAARRYRLGGLLRGRRGSEAAIRDHPVGTRFVLLDQAAMLAIDPPTEALGTVLLARAAGSGDAVAVSAPALRLTGRALRPLSPARLRAWAADGGIEVAWQRRSRAGWNWPDGIDAPLAEDREQYRIVAALDGVDVLETVSGLPSWRWSAAAFAAAGGSSATAATITVAQLGAIGAGEAATVTVQLD